MGTHSELEEEGRDGVLRGISIVRRQKETKQVEKEFVNRFEWPRHFAWGNDTRCSETATLHTSFSLQEVCESYSRDALILTRRVYDLYLQDASKRVPPWSDRCSSRSSNVEDYEERTEEARLTWATLHSSTWQNVHVEQSRCDAVRIRVVDHRALIR